MSTIVPGSGALNGVPSPDVAGFAGAGAGAAFGAGAAAGAGAGFGAGAGAGFGVALFTSLPTISTSYALPFTVTLALLP